MRLSAKLNIKNQRGLQAKNKNKIHNRIKFLIILKMNAAVYCRICGILSYLREALVDFLNSILQKTT
jgi:hypothetical protein